ncbi:MAG: Nif3-like dinuclear metal center hexameric protein [Myxococcota bacterium]|nr:Nif3-like dinuclear metal center hexameric protein [Myxococcota bacterium]
MVKRDVLVKYLNERLNIEHIDDASANGLQVQGVDQVRRVGLATDAALAVYRRAADLGCELIIAHHGIIWGGGIRAVTGRTYEHIRFLVETGIGLYAAHLPLDAHPELGNNAGLAQMVSLESPEPFGRYHGVTLGVAGRLPQPLGIDALAQVWQRTIKAVPLTLPFGPEAIGTVAIVSGGGSGTLPEAIELGMDCLVTGEGKHEDHHLALEGHINVLYLGHYQSETVGVRAVGRELEERFGIEAVFIDEPTRV